MNGHINIFNICFQVNSIDFNYDTSLQIASRKMKLKVVQELLNHDANISQANKFGETVWHTAIRDKENFLFTLLVAHCVEKGIPLKSKVESLLYIAAKRGDLQKIKKLLGLGLDSDERDSSGNTFYHIAARFACIVFNFLFYFHFLFINKQKTVPLKLFFNSKSD